MQATTTVKQRQGTAGRALPGLGLAGVHAPARQAHADQHGLGRQGVRERWQSFDHDHAMLRKA